LTDLPERPAPGAEERAALMRDPMAFGRRLLPHYLSLPPPPFHRALCALWRECVMKRRDPATEAGRAAILSLPGRRLAVAAPRGHAKSTVMSLQNVLHAAVCGYKRYILLISDTAEQACAFLEAIKTELEYNEELLALFGPQKGPVWKRSVILLRNGTRIDALGSGQKVRGRRHRERRPDLIVLDDVENDAAVCSRRSREKLESWFWSAVSKAGDRYTDIVCVGTVLHHDSLLLHLLENPGYRAARFRAVERFSDSPLWRDWERLALDPDDPQRLRRAEAFFRANRRAMLAGTRVLWPRKLSYPELMQMRLSEGEAAFFREMQNEPQDPDRCLFPRAWLQFYGETDFSAGFRFFGYCDPSLGKSADSHFSAIATLALETRTGLMYVLDMDLARRRPDALIDDILEKARRLRRRFGADYTAFGAETNQFQWLLKEELRKRSAAAGIWLPLCEVHHASDKLLRIQSLQPDVKNGYLLFRPDQRELLEELNQFPLGRHDDGPDALEGAVRLCRQYAAPAPLPAPLV